VGSLPVVWGPLKIGGNVDYPVTVRIVVLAEPLGLLLQVSSDQMPFL